MRALGTDLTAEDVQFFKTIILGQAAEILKCAFQMRPHCGLVDSDITMCVRFLWSIIAFTLYDWVRDF